MEARRQIPRGEREADMTRALGLLLILTTLFALTGCDTIAIAVLQAASVLAPL